MPLEKREEMNKTLNPRYIYRDESRSIETLMFSDPKVIIDLHNDFYAWYQELKLAHRVVELQDLGIHLSNLRSSIGKYNMKHNDDEEPLYSGIMDFSQVPGATNQPINKVIDKLMMCFFKTAFDSGANGRKFLFNKMFDAHIMSKKVSKVELEILKRKHNLE